MTDTTLKYTVERSRHSNSYFYVVETERDKFGTTRRLITKPMTKREMRELMNAIDNTISAEVKEVQHYKI